MPRFLNEQDTLHKMAEIMENYTYDERLLLTKQVNVFFMLPKVERDGSKNAHRSREYRLKVLKAALKHLTPQVNLGMLHEYDIERIKGLFLILRCACIQFDPSDVNQILMNELGWPSKVASRVRKMAKDIEQGVWPRSRGCYGHWTDDSLGRWLKSANTND